ncbi:MAG: hypothetical protein DRN01_06855 [Thermoplasmata archaeon]|nr:MAG: hypothetical protein DRN01_06855 [Thermoplasmata archaeon]
MLCKKTMTLTVILLIFSTSTIAQGFLVYKPKQTFFSHDKQASWEVVIIPDNNPFYGVLGNSLACWYNKENNRTVLLPLLVQKNGLLTEQQKRFLNQYLAKNGTLLVVGEHLNTTYGTTEILGSPAEVAAEVSTKVFKQSSTVLILPYEGNSSYKLSLIAAPLASYLNIPILFYDNNEEQLQQICKKLNSTKAFVVGDIQLNLPNISIVELKDEDAVQNLVLDSIKTVFGEINYITLTNPSDIISPQIIDSYETTTMEHIENIKVTVLGREINIIGKDTRQQLVYLPEGINWVRIHGEVNVTQKGFIDPIISLYLYDPQKNVVAYSLSPGYDIGKTYVETLTCDAPGNYTLTVKLYNGVKGGYFLQRGLSMVDTDVKITINVSRLKKPHLPFVPKLSMTAPYLTAAHGGILVADQKFELTSDEYVSAAEGLGTGPWYNEKLQNFNNKKVNYTITELKHVLDLIENHGMLTGYLNGSAWLAILGDTNMIPMYYYNPSQKGLLEKGLPSDNPYSLNFNLSVGRVIGYDVQDVSLLISRTLFYKKICGPPLEENGWHSRFNFVFGEGFGETGGLFHQIPYAAELKKYGFKPHVYGDLRNSRQITSLLQVYTNANYIEYLGHGDWLWFTPSLYGFDYINKAVDVAHAKNWVYNKPSVFLTSACLMARIDGIPPYMNIGVTMLHSGCNCFIGATRSTGQEAGLTALENHLIVDDLSVGEALRGEKRVDKEPPTYYVRALYGDPAFNPYEPNNGFSNQGRPVIQHVSR